MTIKRISEISQDSHIQELLTQLDANHDQQIDSDEVDFDRDAFLDLTSTSSAWSLEDRNEIQNSLFRQHLIQSRCIERLELDGDPSVGSVRFIRQIHDRPGMLDTVRIPVGNYQFSILLYLTSHNATHLFMEGLDHDIPNNPPREAHDIGPLVDSTFHHHLSDEFYISLTQVFAGIFYAYYFPDVYVHRSVETNQEREIFSIINSPWSSQERRRHYTFEVRESIATYQVMHFLRDHPGETSYLIYGSAHEFADNFATYPNPPQLISVSFPDQEKLVDENFQRLISSLEALNNKLLILYHVTELVSAASIASLHFLLLNRIAPRDRIERFYSGRSNNPRKDDDDQNPPTSGASGTSSTPSAPVESSNAGDNHSNMEALGISAGLATLGTAAIQYGPEIVNFARTAGMVGVRTLALGLFLLCD